MRRCTLVRVERGPAVWVSQCCVVWGVDEQLDERGELVDVVQRSCPHCGSDHGLSWPLDDTSVVQVGRSVAAHESSCVRGGSSKRSGGGRRAMYEGWCVSCEKPIAAGAPIASSGGAWLHAGCS